MGANRTVVFATNDAYWRAQRRLFNQALGKQPVEAYAPMIGAEAAALVIRLLAGPDVPFVEVKLYVSISFASRCHYSDLLHSQLTSKYPHGRHLRHSF
jgi:cytochrome P450